MSTKWVKAELPADLVAALQQMADANNETAAETLARAIKTMKFLEEQKGKGRVLLDRADGLEEVRIR